MAVNLSPVFGVAGQLFDNNGNPLAGGKIYTYLAGTTTPAATYTSSSGAIAHSNPIVLDGAGRVPSGEIWLTDGITYKFVVEDSASNLIGTYDNLIGINSNFVAYTSQQEIQTATAGQTVFNLTTMQYQPGTNNLSVFVDGVNQYGPGAQYAYIETDSDTVTFVSGLHVGASVKFTTASPVSSNVTDAENVAYTAPFANTVTTNVEIKLLEIVSVKDFGAIGDGVTDDTTAIQNAINSGAKQIIYPAGNYLAGNLSLVSDQRHVGMGGTITSLDNGDNIFNGVSVSNVDIVGLNFVGTEIALFAVSIIGTLSPASNSSNILIENCTASGGIQLFASYQPAGSTYATITDAMLTDYVRVIGNKIVGVAGSKTGGGLGGIAFYYAKNCVATGNILETLQHGISFWGGNSAPGGDGIQNNTRKAYNITITGNTVSDIGGGGIWGSMGNWITVSGNTVNDCDDVGIDFEGCFNSNATGNTVNNCNNGCLVTYHYLRNVSFVGNICQDTVGGRNIAIQNTFSPLQQDSYDVSFIGNTFVCAKFDAICYVVGGYVQTFAFNENKCTNVVVKDLYDGPRAATYNNNVFVFKATVGATFNVIESTFAHGGTTIKGNTFITEALQPSGSTCIYVGSYQFAAVLECHNISDNVMLRYGNTNVFDYDIKIEDTGGTNTVRFAINNNQLASTNKYGVIGTFVESHLNGNVDQFGNPYPVYVPPATAPSGTWSVGQIAYPAAPVAGGFIGMVCTVAGTPGTWKTFGAISV